MRPTGAIGASTRLAALVLALGLIAPSTVLAETPPPFPQPGSDALARESWIVTLVAGAHPAKEAPGLSRAAGGRVGLVYRHSLTGFQLKGSAAAAAALRRNPRVVSVEPDRAVYLTETLPYGVERVDAFTLTGDGAYQAGFRGAGARIAVLDTRQPPSRPRRRSPRPRRRPPTQRPPRSRPARCSPVASSRTSSRWGGATADAERRMGRQPVRLERAVLRLLPGHWSRAASIKAAGDPAATTAKAKLAQYKEEGGDTAGGRPRDRGRRRVDRDRPCRPDWPHVAAVHEPRPDRGPADQDRQAGYGPAVGRLDGRACPHAEPSPPARGEVAASRADRERAAPGDPLARRQLSPVQTRVSSTGQTPTPKGLLIAL